MKTHRTHRPRRTAAIVLIAISAFMTSFIIIWCANGVMDFLNYLGINRSALQLPYAWMLAAATAAGYILYTAKMIPEVRRNLFCFKGIFKWLGIYAALVGGIVEEAVFRQMLMDGLHDSGTGTLLQIILSALAFGLIHYTWTLLGGNLRTGTASAASTVVLGGLLATIYIAAGRNLLPAIAAHTLINIFVEPWLILNAIQSTPTRRESDSSDIRNDNRRIPR